jgi:hypothetical protein
MIAERRDKHLRLVFQPAERLAVDDAVTVALKGRADRVGRFRARSAFGIPAFHRTRRQTLLFFFGKMADF